MIEEGVARDVVGPPHREAGRDGHASTGHALRRPPRLRADPVQPLDGRRDAASVDELAKLVGDGIYVTRLHYLGVVDPREGIITGMTRDGTFRSRAR